jgi:hypothetical protein
MVLTSFQCNASQHYGEKVFEVSNTVSGALLHVVALE